MSGNNDLFPFPGQTPEQDESDSNQIDLPVFPPENENAQDSLSNLEIKEVRSLIQWFRQNHPEVFVADAASKNKKAESAASDKEELPVFPGPTEAQNESGRNQTKFNFREIANKFLDSAQVTEAYEIETRATLKSILAEISDDATMLKVWGCIVGVFPARKCLRHGTPDQKLFALVALGDRFLQSLAGEVFTNRKKLLKTIAAYLSAISESYNFIQMENENFSPQYHERVQGSYAGGKTIREMHGFVVVAKDSNQVVRAGLVLT
ncbi:MAG: hypothetical protein Kow0029_03690 [Candidatus Rifleibacteriota bacterium]